MLTGSIDTVERFFMKQADKTMSIRHSLHHLHRELVLVTCKIRLAIDRCNLVLGGSHLVVFRLGKHADLPELFVKILHESRNAGLDLTEVVILKLLSLRRLVSEECTSRKTQILTLVVKGFIDQKIFLLRSALRGNTLRFGIAEESQDSNSLL